MPFILIGQWDANRNVEGHVEDPCDQAPSEQGPNWKYRGPAGKYAGTDWIQVSFINVRCHGI